MGTVRRLLLLILVVTAGALSAPAVVALAQTPAPVGLTIRLAEAPSDRADDPRALQYVIDHVAPGAVINRKVEVTNNTGHPTKGRVYGGGATVDGGAFTPDDKGEVASWITATPGDLDLATGQATIVEAKISVPAKATAGERYGVVWAELPGVTGADGITQVNRVGVRVYVSVGDGGEPKSDFTIQDLSAGRTQDGAPIVSARVRNTGGRALDMTGSLELGNGPGGLNAGPFPAKVGTTLGVNQTEPVTVTLDKQVPAGPWEARITLRSGNEEREAKATITFPKDAGETSAPVGATEIEKQKRVFAPIAGALLLVTGGAALALFLRQGNERRRKGRDDLDPEAVQPAAGTKQ